MGTEPINYEAVLADIDARIAKLQATREGILELMGAAGASPHPGGSSNKPRLQSGSWALACALKLA